MTDSQDAVVKSVLEVVKSVLWRESKENDKFDTDGVALLSAQINGYVEAAKPIEFILLGDMPLNIIQINYRKARLTKHAYFRLPI